MPPFDLSRWARALPVGETLSALAKALAERGAAVLEAPPGAGKTTLVPLALLDAPWLAGRRILMLEPRRLAARAAARRMADMLGEAPGETVGYRTRFERRIGARTRIEVVTEGILVRQIQADPGLDGIGLLVFDEFHERSLDADLGLALALESRRHLRDDLRLLVMSATLDGAPVARLLDEAPVIASGGRSFPVAVHHLPRPPAERLEFEVVRLVRRVIDDEDGSLLVFLPGGAEIRRVERLLGAEELPPAIEIAPLYGDLGQAAQDAAIRPPAPGTRKIVLATPIAETSLTIEGVTVVIDSGLHRTPRFEPKSGMTRLVTQRISRASAEQRRGRAGRLGPGSCYRLWSASEHMQLPAFTPPEIVAADLAPLGLELAHWGESDPAALRWLDPPPAAPFAQAQALLQELGALDGDRRITAHGRAMAGLALHPRLAHMALVAKRRGEGRLAVEIAALLSERDPLRAAPGQRDTDLRLRLELLRGRDVARDLGPGLAVDRGALERVRESARQIARQLRLAAEPDEPSRAGRVLALAYPDRVAQRRPGAIGQFRLANGRGAEFPAIDPLAREEFLAIAELDGDRASARVFLAAPLERGDIEANFADRLETDEIVQWDAREEAVVAARRTRLGALVLSEEALREAAPERVTAALLDGIRAMGLAALPWTAAALSLRGRIAFLCRIDGDRGWPDLSDAALLAGLEEWLGPYLPASGGARSSPLSTSPRSCGNA